MTSRSATSGLCCAAALALVAALPCEASARGRKQGPTQVVPPKKPVKDKDDDPSDGGSRRGNLEISLGAASLGGAVALIGRGIWEIGVGRRVKRQCAEMSITDVACNRDNPGNGGFVAAGLSFALAVPFTVAGALLLKRGVKIKRAYKQWHARDGAVAVGGGPGHVGASVSFRF